MSQNNLQRRPAGCTTAHRCLLSRSAAGVLSHSKAKMFLIVFFYLEVSTWSASNYCKALSDTDRFPPLESSCHLFNYVRRKSLRIGRFKSRCQHELWQCYILFAGMRFTHCSVLYSVFVSSITTSRAVFGGFKIGTCSMFRSNRFASLPFPENIERKRNTPYQTLMWPVIQSDTESLWNISCLGIV